MDTPLFASLSEIAWTLLTFWLIWFSVGLVASFWIIRRATQGPSEERAADAHEPVPQHWDRKSA